VILREHERAGRASGRPRKVPDAGAARAAALEKAAVTAANRRRFTALLATDGEVPMSHFAGLETPALVILLGAVEVARSSIDAATGYGEAYAEGASVIVRIRLGRPGIYLPVRVPEGTLVAPDLLITVTPSEAAQRRPAVTEGAA